MNVPISNPNCPPGLEYLASVDQLLIQQKVELFEAFTGFETNNKYVIKNSLGQKVREIFFLSIQIFCVNTTIICNEFSFYLIQNKSLFNE